MKHIYINITCFVIGFALSWIVGGKRKNSEGKYVSNMVIVANTDITKCDPDNEMCYHIHHWMFLAVLLGGYMTINYILGYKASPDYSYLVALYTGASISEYVFYGNDIFRVYQKCYSRCA